MKDHTYMYPRYSPMQEQWEIHSIKISCKRFESKNGQSKKLETAMENLWHWLAFAISCCVQERELQSWDWHIRMLFQPLLFLRNGNHWCFFSHIHCCNFSNLHKFVCLHNLSTHQFMAFHSSLNKTVVSLISLVICIPFWSQNIEMKKLRSPLHLPAPLHASHNPLPVQLTSAKTDVTESILPWTKKSVTQKTPVVYWGKSKAKQNNPWRNSHAETSNWHCLIREKNG